jgi:hypothetical protein
VIRSIKAIAIAAVPASIFMVAAPVAAMASTVQPSVVQPLTGSGCYSGVGTHDLGQECTEVVGSGLKITSISGEYNNTTPYSATVYIDYYGPKGYITKTGNLTVASKASTGYHTWHNPNPNTNEPAGDYCTEAFLVAGNKGIWSDCIQVHT